MKHKIKISKWALFVLLMAYFIITLATKAFTILHLQKIGFNLFSYSPISIILGFILSFLILVLVFLDRGINKNMLKHPTQMIPLFLGILGVGYNSFLTLILIKDSGILGGI